MKGYQFAALLAALLLIAYQVRYAGQTNTPVTETVRAVRDLARSGQPEEGPAPSVKPGGGGILDANRESLEAAAGAASR